jgi:nucleoside-diphosphate-sugar epimerase
MQTLISQYISPLLNLPRVMKRMIALVFDIALCIVTVWLSMILRYSEFVEITPYRILAMLLSVFIAIPIFIRTGFYRAVFRYSGLNALTAMANSVFLYALIYSFIIVIAGFPGVPRTIGFFQPILLLVCISSSRLLVRFWLGEDYGLILKRMNRPKALIYGTGLTGRGLADALVNSPDMQVIGFLEDDQKLQGSNINGLPIYKPEWLKKISVAEDVSYVLLATPNLSRSRRNEILVLISEAHVAVKTLPSMGDLIQGKVSIADLQDLEIEDLLGRDPIAPYPDLMSAKITGKVVLVTGAGGSIGGELCRQIMQLQPKILLLIDHSEAALYAIHQEMAEKWNHQHLSVIPLIASVQDKKRMSEILNKWHPHTVYHAAAYKHVPLVEHNPAEGVRNNVFGTLTIANLAIEAGVNNFILISTDKAVRPTNMMGASKRLAEMILQAYAQHQSKTIFTMVRFGNVLGSSGSVVPKFREQIRGGGPISVTHPEMTRYFMTIPEAVQLVIQAGALANGGEVFVLDMGDSVKIMDLAKRMVELSGLTLKNEEQPNGDIEIEITGLRPGEKLYEELLIGDNPEKTSHPRIIKASEEFIALEDLKSKLDRLEQNLQHTNDMQELRAFIAELVPEYSPMDEIVDWVYLQNTIDSTEIT